MHDIQTDGESLTSHCKHATLANFLEFIDLVGRLSVRLWSHASADYPADFSSADLTSNSWILSVFLCSPRRSLSGCPRARKGGLKLTPNKDDKDEQELK